MKLSNFSATFYSLTTFLLGLKGVDLIKWEVSHGTISPAKAAYLRESSGTGSLHVPVPKTLFKAYILYYIYPQYTFSRFDQHFSRFVSAFSI